MALLLKKGLSISSSSTKQVYKSLRKPLHNLDLPRDQLIWGAKNLVKCVKEEEIKPLNLRRKVSETSVVVGEKGMDNTIASAVKRKSLEKSEEKVKFSMSLRKEEIEHDFMILTGEKPPKRPTKRRRDIQKQLDELVPGLWLSEISLEKYIVEDVPQRRNG